MTREFNTHFNCSNCGCRTTAQTSFGRWLRNHDQLDSSNGHAFYDVDWIFHRFKTDKYGRDWQFIMLAEIKTHGAQLSDSQRDTLYIVSQLTQNRKQNETTRRFANKDNANDLHAASRGAVKAYSTKAKKYVNVKSFGYFTLVFSETGPQDSEWIEWNGKRIDTDTLKQIVGFEIDPITFKSMDELLRIHHKKNGDDWLPLFA